MRYCSRQRICAFRSHDPPLSVRVYFIPPLTSGSLRFRLISLLDLFFFLHFSRGSGAKLRAPSFADFRGGTRGVPFPSPVCKQRFVCLRKEVPAPSPCVHLFSISCLWDLSLTIGRLPFVQNPSSRFLQTTPAAPPPPCRTSAPFRFEREYRPATVESTSSPSRKSRPNQLFL